MSQTKVEEENNTVLKISIKRACEKNNPFKVAATRTIVRLSEQAQGNLMEWICDRRMPSTKIEVKIEQRRESKPKATPFK
jgi:hypothetical protein